MKKYLVDKAMLAIEKKENYSKTKLAEIRYGLETLYLTITKTIVILTASYFFGLLKELLLILLFYGILRVTGFGLHAKKTWQCWITSGIIFLLFPYLVQVANLNFYTKIFISISCTIFILIYAPADTEKRPLIRPLKRKIYKIICTLSALAMIIYSFITKDTIIQNSIHFSLILQCMMICPLTYKIFKLRYANYKYYKKGITA